MDKKRAVKYWFDGAIYDLETAYSLLEAGRFPYALFFGHLALEKLLKAVVVNQTETHAPHTHSLTILAERAKLDMTPEVIDLLAGFSTFNIEARYPDEKSDFYKRCTREFAEAQLAEMKKVFEWLRQKSGM